MIYLLLVISVVLAIALQAWQRYIEYFPENKVRHYRPTGSFTRQTVAKNFFRRGVLDETEQSSKLKVAVIRGFKKFCISLAIVALLFSVFQLWLQNKAYSQLAQQSVLALETNIHWLREKVKVFEKYQFGGELIALVTLTTLALLWPLIEKTKLKTHFKKMMQVAGFLIGVLTLASSFTFFGHRIKDTEKGIEGKLVLHELRIIEDNQLLLQHIQESVEEKVSEAILEEPDVADMFREREQLQSSIDSLLASPGYALYQKLKAEASSVTQEIHGLKPLDIRNAFAKFEQAYLAETAPIVATANSSNGTPFTTDFYQAVRNRQYEAYAREQVIRNSELSEKTVKNAAEIFQEANNSLPRKAGKLFEQYGDVFEKTFQKTYDVTIKDWVKGTVSGICSQIPFIGELLDPLHDLLQDIILDKTKKIYRASLQGDQVSAETVLKSIRPDVSRAIQLNGFTGPWKVNRQETLQTFRATLSGYMDLIGQKNLEAALLASDYLQQLKMNSRWQLIRDQFHQRALREAASGTPDDAFTREQWGLFNQRFEEWNHHMESNKIDWWQNQVKDIEPLFYRYIERDPAMCGAWGFILQQEDWEGARYFYTVHPDSEASGKPRYLLKYYCETTGLGSIDRLYTRAVDEKGVDPLCPHP